MTKQVRMLLLDFYEDVYLLSHDLKDGSAVAMRTSLRAIEAWNGRPLSLRTLTEERVSRFLKARKEQGASPKYLHRMRGDILAVWREAARKGLASKPDAEDVRQIRVPQRMPEAWTDAEAKAFLAACGVLPGYYDSGVARSLWWKAWTLVAWDTGLRICDLTSLRFDQFDAEGRWVITQQKTGWGQVGSLSPPTIEALRLTVPPERAVCLPWLNSLDTFRDHFRKISKAAGLSGTPKKIRKSAASALESEQPGAAMSFLGHRTPGLAERNYLDPRISRANRPRPRQIG